MTFSIIFGFANLLLAVVLFISFRKALEMRDKAVRREIAAVLIYTGTFSGRQWRKKFNGLADIVLDPVRCKFMADNIRQRYAAEVAKRKAG